MERERAFPIGQFAALHGINKKTLMWYDEIGLFQPALVRENGYRCYTYRQSALLETILMLRELDVSIPEIRAFLDERSSRSFVRMMDERLADVDRRIAHLERVRADLAARQQAHRELLEADLSRIDIVEKPAETLVPVPLPGGLPVEEIIDRVLASARTQDLPSLHHAQYGALLPVERLEERAFGDYDGLFIRTEGPVQGPTHLRPAGPYLRAYCKGDWNLLPRRYGQILDYVHHHGLRLTGHAYEVGVNEDVVATMDDYITLIEIPLKNGC